jgi:hypothetical protein
MSRLGRLIRRSVLVSVPGGGGTPTPTLRYWSDPKTWDGTTSADLPQAGDTITIAAGDAIVLDVKTPVLGKIVWNGQIVIPKGMDTGIECTGIMGESGELTFGDGTSGNWDTGTSYIRMRGPLTGKTPRMVAARAGDTPVQKGYNISGFDRSFMLEDGFQIRGSAPAEDHHWRLADNVGVGQNFIKVRGTANAKQGDKFVISTTDYFGMSGNEEMTVASDSTGDTITFTTNFARFHWGKMLWVTKTADRVGHLGYVDEGWRSATTAPNTFDNTAHVMRTNRRFVFDGSDQGLGARLMWHGRSGTIDINGWEFAYPGFAGVQQGYPCHPHMISYEMPDGPNAPSNGNYVGGSLEASLASGHSVRNCSFHHSQNRGVVLHGANGVTVEHNVFYDIIGSSIFGEEGAQQLCVVNDCHILKTRPPAAGDLLQDFDGFGAGNGIAGNAAIWWTNPNNTLTNCSSGDMYTGIWNAFTNRNTANMAGYGCFGLCKNIQLSPGALNVKRWFNNEMYSFAMKGIVSGLEQADEAGGTSDIGYDPPGFVPVFEQMKFWKGSNGAYHNRVGEVRYLNASAADICGTVFNGAARQGSIAADGLFIAESLNSTPRPAGAPTKDAVAVTYHEQVVFPGMLAVGFSFNGVALDDERTNGYNLLTSRGVFKSWSEYLYPTAGWIRRSPNMELLNSTFMYRTPPQHLEQEDPFLPGRPIDYGLRGDIAGIFNMYYNYAGGSNGMVWIYNIPFFTYGAANLTEALPAGSNNGMLTTTRGFGLTNASNGTNGGMYDFIEYAKTDPKWARDWRRLNPSTLAEVGHWTTPGGDGSGKKYDVGFQHVGVMAGGVYKILTPDIPQIYWCQSVFGSRDPGAAFVLCVPFTGSKVARVCAASNGGYEIFGQGYWSSDFKVSLGIARRYTAGTSAADIINGASNRFWQDTANNCVWLKYEGGFSYPAPEVPPTDEQYDQAPVYIAVSAAP